MKTIQELIEFFEKIPEEKWCENHYEWPAGSDCRCALGHLNYHIARRAIPEWNETFGPCSNLVHNLGLTPEDIIDANNDRAGHSYSGNTPRIRVINFLKSANKEIIG